MHLDRFENKDFERGASRGVEALWMVVSSLFFASWLPGSGWRVALLRMFGAKIGTGVIIKPGVRVKFPWRLAVGDHCWIGESAWIDNLGEVRLGDHVCISQGAYLCTGSHDWSCDTFDLIVKPIQLGSHAWVGAAASLAPGTVVEDGAIVAMSSFARGRLVAWHIHGLSSSPKPRPRPPENGADVNRMKELDCIPKPGFPK